MSTPERGRVPASMLLRSNRTDDLSVDLKKSKQPPPLRRTDLHTKSPRGLQDHLGAPRAPLGFATAPSGQASVGVAFLPASVS